MASRRADVRNVAIIAHVDHGKTTLVDRLLAVAGAFTRGEQDRERAMDSGDLERERGITITAKPTALVHGDVRINMVDTPGHADFGGEVERVLNMVDAVLLLVDAFEGPMPQTRFVTQKAIERGLPLLLVVNKVDRPGCRPRKAVDDTFDLLVDLGASEQQAEFPVVYASAREGWTRRDPDGENHDMGLLLDEIVAHLPGPVAELDKPLALWVSTLAYDPFLGFLAVGRIRSGRISPGDRIARVRPVPGGEPEVEIFRATRILGFQGLKRFELGSAEAGDITAVAGMESLQVGDTLTVEDPAARIVFPPLEVDPPTMSIRVRVNDGPFAGKEGQFVTSRKIGDRLTREARSNVALRVFPTESAEEFEVHGRGELHLGVLLETMRREGYEMCVSRPHVLLHRDEHGRIQEPYERVLICCDEAYTGAVIEKLGPRGAEMLTMGDDGPGRTRMELLTPTRALIGYRAELLGDTRGTGTMASVFDRWGPHLGEMRSRRTGVQIVLEDTETSAYSLHRLQDRGQLFVGAQLKVYAGMIVGSHSRDSDIVVNPGIAKKLTNIRSAGADEKLFLAPPRVMSLEESVAYIADDELVEITPVSLRLRKRYLDHNVRKRHEKASAAVSG